MGFLLAPTLYIDCDHSELAVCQMSAFMLFSIPNIACFQQYVISMMCDCVSTDTYKNYPIIIKSLKCSLFLHILIYYSARSSSPTWTEIYAFEYSTDFSYS